MKPTYTFGKTLAALRLEEMLKNNPSARRKVSSLLSRFTSQMFKFIPAKDPDTILLSWELYRDHTLRCLDSKENLSDDIRTYTKNIIIYRYRVILREFENLYPLIEAFKKKKCLTSDENDV